jgi:hypothetical protein
MRRLPLRSGHRGGRACAAAFDSFVSGCHLELGPAALLVDEVIGDLALDRGTEMSGRNCRLVARTRTMSMSTS